MILHFSHIGLTDGLTFNELASLSSRMICRSFLGTALATAAGRRYHTEACRQRNIVALLAQRAILAGAPRPPAAPQRPQRTLKSTLIAAPVRPDALGTATSTYFPGLSFWPFTLPV